MPEVLEQQFFDTDGCELAMALIGKVIRHRCRRRWLAARIIEAEAYYATERASHSSLGRTPSREPMFMAPGTIYMYHARGGPSLNVSSRGEGNAVLIKSGVCYVDERSPESNIAVMQQLCPPRQAGQPRDPQRLCSGQTLLCRSLGLTVEAYTGQQFDPKRFFIEDVGLRPAELVQTRRLGIPAGRDEHLLYRFVDRELAACCTSNPLTKRSWQEGIDYRIIGELSNPVI